MAWISAVTAGVLTLLGAAAMTALLLQTWRPARAHRATAKHAGTLLPAAIMVLAVLLVRAILYFAGVRGPLALTLLMFATESAAALMLAGFLRGYLQDEHGQSTQGATTAGVVFIATGAASALLVSGGDGNLRAIALFNGATAGAWAAAFANARLTARAQNQPPWMSAFALVAAYLLVIGAYGRVLLMNTAVTTPGFFELNRLEHAAVFLASLLFAWPALDSVARHLREANRAAPARETLAKAKS